MMKAAMVFFPIIFALQVCVVEGKLQRGSITFAESSVDQHRGQFLSKFGYGIGAGTYSVRFRLRSHSLSPQTDGFTKPSLDFGIFLDEDWKDAEAISDCPAQLKKARTIHKVEVGSLGETG